MLWHKSLFQQRLRSLQHGAQLVLHIQHTSAPEDAVLQNPCKGRLFPCICMGRHHVIVRKHYRRISRHLPRHMDQDSRGVYTLHLCLFPE